MGIWDELSREESVVLVNALEEAWLNQVIGDYLGHREENGIWRFSGDLAAITPLIPGFAAIVRSMIERDLIDLVPTDRYEDQPRAPRMTDAEVDAALGDPATWLPPVGPGPVMVIATGHVIRRIERSKDPI
ncbi:hypothetical protein [Actinoplanes auranticolor]|uniref:Uncharacterized protein n=1 Tax=Actinoplanes auranticolor TaxID=47988 RepID=A0A919SD83_9ACTN|nr:hypothetical protein [Actinoplanes auranticolor]GIM68472.1 hypothetical protein Aau02nite_31800 [Actinoplanes auranticolor]